MRSEKKNIIDMIEQQIKPGTDIPKPEATGKFSVKGWGMRRGERALIYYIPNHNNPGYPHQKGINVPEWEMAYNQLLQANEFTKKWFSKNMPACDKEGSCNFTTIGGIFVLLGLAKYVERGVYRSNNRIFVPKRKNNLFTCLLQKALFNMGKATRTRRNPQDFSGQ